MKTMIFEDSHLTWKEPTRKNGIRKAVWSKVVVEDTMHPHTISFNGVTKVLYTRGKDANERSQPLYNEDGTHAIGSWKHGIHGSMIHKEWIELFGGKLETRTSYSSGQIKDQHKYLLGI